MYINSIEDTCSMYEIGSLYEYKIKTFETKAQFYKYLHEEVIGGDWDYSSIQCLMTNVLYNTDQFKKDMKRLGFKKVNEYIGNTKYDDSDEYKPVYCYMLNLTPTVKKAFCKANKLDYEETFGKLNE